MIGAWPMQPVRGLYRPSLMLRLFHGTKAVLTHPKPAARIVKLHSSVVTCIYIYVYQLLGPQGNVSTVRAGCQLHTSATQNTVLQLPLIGRVHHPRNQMHSFPESI